MARKVICDRCGDEYPHVVVCDACGGSGDYVDGGTVHKGQCSVCRGRGERVDLQEGKGLQVTIGCDDGRSLVLNVTVSDFYKDQPDFCGNCLPVIVREAFCSEVV
jgi:DnaJ-class molecular chaperone